MAKKQKAVVTNALFGDMVKVNDSITLNRYENGWMLEIGGRNDESDWVTKKILCNTEEEVLQLIKDYNGMELND